MFAAIDNWFYDSAGLTAHGFCLLWQPGLIWTYALSDTAIALAYFSIPLALAVIARRRRDLVFRPLLWLFAAFILLCGATHWLDVITLFAPAYGIEAIVKVATAVVSVFTAIALWRLLPQALTLPSPAQYREANAALQASQERFFQSQKMEVVGQLTGGVAHDFNNILQVIASGLTLMERRIAQGRTTDAGAFVPSMRQAVDSAAALVHRLLAFSRRQALQPRVVDAGKLIAGMEDLVRRTLGPFVDVQIRPQSGRWRIFCDVNQLESTLLNLAINARDAMPEGGALVVAVADRVLTGADVAGEEGLRPGDYVELAVTDTGRGMSADVVARVFEPFFTTKPNGKGTGLGLSQVYGFVKQSGGFVRIESKPGRGTTVRVFLPADARAEDPAPPVAPAEAPGSPHLLGDARALVVEDRDDVRGQIVIALGEIGCAVVEAADGAAALALLRSGARFDLLVTDIAMPGANGRQVAEAARALQPDLPVLLMTGFAGDALDGDGPPEGMEVMRKPFSLDAMTARLRAMLAERRQTATLGL